MTKTTRLILVSAFALLAVPAAGEAAAAISYDWAANPASSTTNFARGWVAGAAVNRRIAFSDALVLSPTTKYVGPAFYGGASFKVVGTTNGTTPTGINGTPLARVSSGTSGDEVTAQIAALPLSTGGTTSLEGAAIYYFKAGAPFQVGDTSLRFVNGNRAHGSRFQWVLRDTVGRLFVSDMSISLEAAGLEFISNNLTSRRWALLDTSAENLLDAPGDYLPPSELGLDFAQIDGAGVMVTQRTTHKNSGTPSFYATIRQFQAYPHDPARDASHLTAFYFGNSLTGCTYPEGHRALGTSAGKRWEALAKLGAGWQLWQHRYEIYVGADLGGMANGDYTLDPSQAGDSAAQLDAFVSKPWEAMVIQPFGNVLWNEVVTQKWDVTFPEPTDVGDPQSADDLIAAYLALNPAGKVYVYMNWHGMAPGVVPPQSEWPAWTETFNKPEELVPGETSVEFPDRDSFVYDTQFLDFYQSEDPPWENNRNWTRDYRHELFTELIARYPDLWAQGRLAMIPTGEVFRRLDQIYSAGGDPEINNPAVTEKITRIADFYTDSLHVRGGMAQFTCAATFYAAMFNEHPGSLDWTIYNNAANWGDDPTHDATPILQITAARAEQVCNTIWTVFRNHPYTAQRVSPFAGTDPNADGMATVWGRNDSRQIGREEITGSVKSPLALKTGITVVPGGGFAFALGADGQGLGFGANERGQLGDATFVGRAFPYGVTLLPAVTQIACGRHHAAAVTAGGQVWCWGSNDDGQLGDDFGRSGHAINGFAVPPENARPRPVSGLPSAATQVACGNAFTLALLGDGTVYAWGRDTVGQLGDGSPGATGVSTPQAVPGLSSIAWVGACEDFAVALRSDGAVFSWGANDRGQLGVGDQTDRSSPTQVPGLGEIKRLALGNKHVLAISASNTLVAWGDNTYGQLALDPASMALRTSPASNPIGVALGQIAAGARHSLALSTSARVYAWGGNNYGQLGLGTTVSSHTPQLITALTSVASIAARGDQSSAKSGAPAAANLVVDPEFNIGMAGTNSYWVTSDANANGGWRVKLNDSRWNHVASGDKHASADNSGTQCVVQILSVAGKTGTKTFRYSTSNTGTTDLRVYVWGVNEACQTNMADANRPKNKSWAFTGTQLYAKTDLGAATYGWREVTGSIDLGQAGYQFLVLKVYSGGVDGGEASKVDKFIIE